MESYNSYPTPTDKIEEKNSLLYNELNKQVKVITKTNAVHYNGILTKVQGNFILLKDGKNKIYISIDEISCVKSSS